MPQLDLLLINPGGRDLIYQDLGSAYTVRCENGDFEMTSRGL